MAEAGKLIPITLHTWPMSDDCLSWSEDDLAVAGGEVVHILTPKKSSSHLDTTGHPQWNFRSFRVNLFEQDEWPEQTLATIENFSIGEEQSNSHIIALAWSNPGLARHRRSILGILTSNMVLSIWELDHAQAEYRRTCVVNSHMIPQDSPEQDETDRRSLRVRSFAWLPLLKTATTSKWGFHYLVVADDHLKIAFLRISKEKTETFGELQMEQDLILGLDHFDLQSTGVELMSPLQKRMYEGNAVASIDTGLWRKIRLVQPTDQADGSETELDREVFVTEVILTTCVSTFKIAIAASVSKDGQRTSLCPLNDLKSCGYSVHDCESRTLPIQSSQTTHAQHRRWEANTVEEYFKEELQPLRDDFNLTFQLSGHIRIRSWGSASSCDETLGVLCVTLHPSDMIEYTIPSSEKCSLVFKHIGQPGGDRKQHSRTPVSVHEDILQHVNHTLKSGFVIESMFDKRIVFTYTNLARLTLDATSELKISLKDLETDFTAQIAQKAQAAADNEQNANKVSNRIQKVSEECEICDAPIAFTSDLTRGNCDSGHRFTRCQLSFLAIQQPGISKFCSRCGKQFLDLVKLGTVSGPSFAQAIFDEFDVCPYCQGKYRG